MNSLSAIFNSIRFKLPATTIALLAIVTLSLYLLTGNIMSRYILAEVIKRAESIGNNIAISAGYSLISRDVLGLDNIIFTAKEMNHDIDYIAIIGNDMKTIVHSDINRTGERFKPAEGTLYKKSPDGTTIKEEEDKGRFEVISPVFFKTKRFGMVAVGINKSVLTTAQREAKKKILIVFCIFILFGTGGSVLISHLLTRPVRELLFGVHALKDGKAERPLRVYSGDELGELTKSFNEMTALIITQSNELKQYAKALEDAYVSTVRVVSAAIDARDHYTRGHSERVSALSCLIAREIITNQKELEELEIACLFHDVGKLKTPDAILLKRERLTREEYREMMRHTEYGASILEAAPSLRDYIPAVKHHHEWFDGSGYPDGLKGDNIPLHAAIIAIADSFDAMTTDRPYRNALAPEQALQEISCCAGKQFHPALTDIFLKIAKQPGFTFNRTGSREYTA